MATGTVKWFNATKGFVKVTAVVCVWRDMPARKQRSTPRVRATPPTRPSVSACRLAS